MYIHFMVSLRQYGLAISKYPISIIIRIFTALAKQDDEYYITGRVCEAL